MTDTSALITRAEQIAGDVNQLPSARTFAREAAVALGEMEREVKRGRDYFMDAEEREAACCPENVGFDEYIAVLTANNARLEHQLREQSEARRLLEDGLTAAVEMLKVETRWYQERIHPSDYKRDTDQRLRAIEQALAILTGQPKAPQNERGRDAGVSQEVSK